MEEEKKEAKCAQDEEDKEKASEMKEDEKKEKAGYTTPMEFGSRHKQAPSAAGTPQRQPESIMVPTFASYSSDYLGKNDGTAMACLSEKKTKYHKLQAQIMASNPNITPSEASLKADMFMAAKRLGVSDEFGGQDFS